MLESFSNNIDISIIIVTYKSWNDLRNCLLSIKEANSLELKLEVVVVDNCSNDGNIFEFKKEFPNLKFIENTGNNGFANGCNLGAKNALGKYLFFLNPDTIINKDSIVKMFTFLEKHANCGIVSCNQKNTKGSYENNIRFFPNLETLFGLFRVINKSNLIKRIKNKNNVIYTEWVSGAVVFISKFWFDKINGWNEDFWMYFEDVDLSKKVTDLGGEICLLTNTEIIHNHGGSSRINIKTALITKTEVLISKHVYIRNHFKGFKYFILQLLVVLNNLIGKIISVILGLIFFFVPKLRLKALLYFNILKYYFSSLKNKTWLSPKSMNYPHKSV
ncbi:glycosyltransferase family 2 protein [Polaribacter butkevichii]|uniref:Uncharacterized protein n=1 Tax=Polaribacter butkevichii TaxID=218490 RepID=A0A2P6CF88_9FLAO|nr:glycosyltransferase family 2 protein [Polaribacter butkevichii]PQJ73526.1 hypothetical protein BTO14_09735 [Polaribacter butkevichii]